MPTKDDQPEAVPGASDPGDTGSLARLLLGALFGALVVFALAPFCIGWFSVPIGGIGTVTITRYPKGFDYFVVIALIGASALGALVLSPRRRPTPHHRPPTTGRRTATLVASIAVFVVMCVAHDHPYAHMDMFHEGEHLTAASVMLDGGRPYGDVFLLHGLATDGGLDALALGGNPSPKRTRRMQTLLDAAALALLVPIAAELTATTSGLVGAVVLALGVIGAGQMPVFPYFRWLPLLVAVLALLRYQRECETGLRGQGLLFVAAIASSLGVLWSFDVGICAVAATAIVILLHTRRVTLIALAAVAAPLLVLLAARADLSHFVRDSFVIIPGAIDAIWSLPAKALPPLSLLVHPVALWNWLGSDAARYYLPPVFFGFLLALAWQRRDRRIATVAVFSILLFRSAAGRCGPVHTRFALPLLGIAVVAFVLEPWVRKRPLNPWRSIAILAAAVIGFSHFEIARNATRGATLLAGWSARQRPDGLVPYPMPRGRGIYTTPENSVDLAALHILAERAGPGPIFDLTGERALYYLLDRRPATRCPDIAFLSAPELGAEALRQLNARPPVLVVLERGGVLGSLGGIPNRDRIPEVAAWIDAHYPVRVRAGSYLVGLRREVRAGLPDGKEAVIDSRSRLGRD